MESTKYKTGSFSADGAWSNRELNKFRKQQGLKSNISEQMLKLQLDTLATRCVQKIKKQKVILKKESQK